MLQKNSLIILALLNAILHGCDDKSKISANDLRKASDLQDRLEKDGGSDDQQNPILDKQKSKDYLVYTINDPSHQVALEVDQGTVNLSEQTFEESVRVNIQTLDEIDSSQTADQTLLAGLELKIFDN